MQHWPSQDSFPPFDVSLKSPTPSWLFSPFHSANINRVIWKSRVVENLTAQILKTSFTWQTVSVEFLATFRKMRRLPCTQQERILFFLGLVYRVVHRSAISSCMQVINSGVMSIYSFSYCRLVKRMTSCWLALLMGNSSFTFLWHKAVESMTGTLFSCFYVHITT